LVRTIESEVIPRLVLARRVVAPRASEGFTASTDDALELAALVIGRDESLAISYVEAMRARGVSPEMLCLELLAPAARHLGKLWDQDRCSFMEVTLGLWRLQRVLCDLSPMLRGCGGAPRAGGLRALLVPVHGEQHTFGLYMVAEFFRRAGWEVSSGPIATRAELVRTVRDEGFSLLGISVSSERHLEAVAASIRAVRRASRNRAIAVMVGGQIFGEQPDLARRLGADATAVDARQAILQAHNLLTLLARYR
jgi:methylmalonyl-CoA mutase cobalamin-binding domain/chain